jgi:hypothetical protein
VATLNDKTTDGSDSFKKYVTNNPRAFEIDFVIENNKTTKLLIKKNNNWIEDVTLTAGTKFKITKKQVEIIGNLRCAAVKYGSKNGFLPLNKIRKPTVGNGTSYEDDVVNALNDMFKQFGEPITIKVGFKTYKDMCFAVKVDSTIKKAAGTKADPKADIIICKDKKNPVAKGSIYISHKKEGGPEAYQQYSGLTEVAGEAINKHKEVQKFLKKVKEYVVGDKLKNAVMMPVVDETLINMAIFGPDYGKDFSLQHCQLIGQGKPILTKLGNYYKLTFSSHTCLSGDLTMFNNEGYKAVFGATYREGRGYNIGAERVNGVRVGIYPKKLLQGRSGLVILK